MPELQTDRLTIRSFTHDLVKAALENRESLEQLLAARVPASWPGPEFAEVLPLILAERRQQPTGAEWSGLIIHRADQLLIGDIGFKAAPEQQGVVEIGYSIIPAYRGHGYAGEAARAMFDWALQRPEVRSISAACLVDNQRSIRVLEKLGMRRSGEEQSEEGLLIRWELPRD